MEWTIFILGLILGIPLSIVANLATPYIKSAYEKSVFTSRVNKMKFIISDYKTQRYIVRIP